MTPRFSLGVMAGHMSQKYFVHDHDFLFIYTKETLYTMDPDYVFLRNLNLFDD